MAEVSYSFLPAKNIKLSRIGLSVKSFKNDKENKLEDYYNVLPLFPYNIPPLLNIPPIPLVLILLKNVSL